MGSSDFFLVDLRDRAERETTIDGLEIPTLLPGITITTGADDFYPVEQMQMVQFDGETWQELGEILSAD